MFNFRAAATEARRTLAICRPENEKAARDLYDTVLPWDQAAADKSREVSTKTAQEMLKEWKAFGPMQVTWAGKRDERMPGAPETE